MLKFNQLYFIIFKHTQKEHSRYFEFQMHLHTCIQNHILIPISIKQ